jgi:hypothetical protein
VQAAEPLPPLISADPTGSHRTVSTRRLPSWVGGLGMAFAGALVVLVGLSIYEALQGSSSARATDHGWIPNLALDVPRPEPTPAPSPDSAEVVTPEPAPQPVRTTSSASTDTTEPPEPVAEAGEDDVVLEPARKPKRVDSSEQDPLDGFKQNPY